jgi:hypothetical protein
MTHGSEENYINAADKLCVGWAFTGVDRWRGLPNNRLRNSADIPDFHAWFHLNNDAGKLSRLMVATHKYRETMTCRLIEGRPDSVLYAEDQLCLKYTSTKVAILSPQRRWSRSCHGVSPWPTHNLIKPLQHNPTQDLTIIHPRVSTNHVRVHAAHDHEHGCYNSFTLYRGCTRYPWVVIILG